MSQDTTHTNEIEVLVVGAGPTGMVMASEVQRHGMHCRIIDSLSQPSHTSKALGIQARTLELFEKMGVAESILDKGVKLTAMNIFSNHRRIAQIRMQYISSRYPFLLSLPQWETEDILNAHLKQQKIDVERGVALTDLQQTERGVNIVLEHANGQREKVHTRWLIGCDGPHSTVRHLLGLPFGGWTFEQSFALADVHLDCYLPVSQASFFWQGGNFIACLPLSQGQYRLLIGYRPHTEPEGDVTLEELQHALEECGWNDVRVNDVVWSSRFQVNQRKVRHYRQGAVFLAGDACHIHSPIAGQGMNTGIQDAFNLAWKLALVSRMEAHPEMLDSYEAERERFGRQLLRGTDLFSRLALLQGPLSSRLRDNITPLVASLKPMGKWIATRIAQIDVSYRGSSIVSEYVSGHRLEISGKWRGCHAGERAPDVQILLGNTPTRTHTLCLETRHVLFFFAHRQRPEWSLPAWQEIDTVLRHKYRNLVDAFLVFPHLPPASAERESAHIIYDENAALSKAYGIPDDGLALVRPDGYIAFLCHPVSLERFWAYLERLFVPSQVFSASAETRSEVGSSR